MKTIKIPILPIVLILLVACMGIVLSYSAYGAPHEFGNITTTTCWIGGDFGELNCTGSAYIGGDVTATNFYGTFNGNSSIWSRAGTFIFPTNIGDFVGIGTSSPDSVFHIKANIAGSVGSHSAGQIIIQNPADDNKSNVVITAYESDGSGNPDQQLWYLGSSSSSNSNIIFLNRRNALLQFGTNDNTQMTILGNGNVGIGTVNPTAKLHIYTLIGGEDLLFLRDQINTADLTIDSPTGALMEIRAGVGDHLQLSSGATANQGIRIRNDGNVGIGTTNPSERLEVNGSIFMTNDNDKMLFGAAKDAAIYYNGTHLFIDTQEVGAGDLIIPNGLVGIGTSSPDHLLDVAGNIGLDKGDGGRFLITNGAQDVAKLGDLGGGTDGQLALYDSTGTATIILSGDGGSGVNFIGSGNFGIGTSVPLTTLQVAKTTFPILSLNRANTTTETIGETMGQIRFGGAMREGSVNDYRPATAIGSTVGTFWGVADQNKAGNLNFYTQDNTNSNSLGTPRMTINYLGNVDIIENFTAGTIQADNGFTGACADGTDLTVVGGIITGCA